MGRTVPVPNSNFECVPDLKLSLGPDHPAIPADGNGFDRFPLCIRRCPRNVHRQGYAEHNAHTTPARRLVFRCRRFYLHGSLRGLHLESHPFVVCIIPQTKDMTTVQGLSPFAAWGIHPTETPEVREVRASPTGRKARWGQHSIPPAVSTAPGPNLSDTTRQHPSRNASLRIATWSSTLHFPPRSRTGHGAGWYCYSRVVMLYNLPSGKCGPPEGLDPGKMLRTPVPCARGDGRSKGFGKGDPAE
jgi:hypothetical protein